MAFRRLLRVVLCALMFPVDAFRLTLLAWRCTLDAGAMRFLYSHKEQRCPFCLDCDHSVSPRWMHREIRYWNGWMIRLLMPHLKFKESKTHIRKVARCRNITGYVRIPAYTALLAILLTAGWLQLLVWLVLLTER